MSTVKYSVAFYHGIGENPMVILLDREKGRFKRQHETIDELKADVGENAIIYFVSDKNDTRLPDLHNWHGGFFNFNELEKLS